MARHVFKLSLGEFFKVGKTCFQTVARTTEQGKRDREILQVCVGMFWPGIASLRGVYFPENCRSTAINIFRIPLNFIVILILLKDLSLATIFSCCVFFLLLAAVAQQLLFVLDQLLRPILNIKNCSFVNHGTFQGNKQKGRSEDEEWPSYKHFLGCLKCIGPEGIDSRGLRP